ncbi:thiosulfate/3-mercaptopyruvate sulfurtransferase [Breoghania corrubedonensis]|uniref:Thiosulfate/3-mercaptopyruvate sulfurtransferase n=1 Tax=Breoghania corrubedonensis TaxID=665038 RepID=A0A2T5V1E9_9HYPH|nr:sulfurtransferase [Breoghania corrubedonensis]PTW57560.1 thiosulfate/3-mercaptopyruvate sulfurtransferase [Breoghania corrubedonensis]
MLSPIKSFATAIAAVAISATVALAATPALSPLVTTGWLKDHLDEKNLVILDIRPATAKDKAATYGDGHVPGAISAPYPGAWRAKRDGVPAQMPSVDALEAYLSGIGVTKDKTVVVIPSGASSSDFSAGTRVYWTLKELGLDNLAILDGGIRAWKAAGLELSTDKVEPKAASFKAAPDPDIIISTDEVAGDLGTRTVLVDARPEAFFTGETKHKLASRPGRLPGAVSLDQNTFFDAATGKLKPKAELSMIASAKVGDPDANIVSYCNTGHWASADWFVLHEVLGYENVKLYDASMVGWTMDPGRPVDLGAPNKD